MTPNPTVRISERAHRQLKELAAKTGQPMQTVIDQAVETYRQQRFVFEANASYARLRENEGAWANYQEELGAWEATLADDLPPKPAGEKKRSTRRTT
ncbi:MAG: toxin-antitoxin system protein [Armatimonadetes bacterium]|nr:toxin-antitoxin system protein [Armatimonadota bacterium]